MQSLQCLLLLVAQFYFDLLQTFINVFLYGITNIRPTSFKKKEHMSIKAKIQEVLDKWKVQLSVEEPKKVELAATAKAADGSEIGTPTAFEVGAEVYVMIEDAPQAVPDGEIAMEDGSIVVVKDGKIESITPKAEEMSSDVLAAFEKLAERVSVLEGANAAQATELSTANAKITELTTKLSAAEKKAVDAEKKVVELGKQAATASVKDKTAVELKKEKEKQPKDFSRMTYVERVLNQN
jgi:hypothetical protein